MVVGSCFLFLGTFHTLGLDVQGNSFSFKLAVLLKISSIANKAAAK